MDDASLSPALKRLHAHYESLASSYHLEDRSIDYASLVVPAGNDTQPVHRWFRYKEAYSFQLLERLFKDASDDLADGLRLIDPFVGSGTSLVSAMSIRSQEPAHLIGVERNPFVASVAKAKCAAMLSGKGLCGLLDAEYVRFVARYKKHMRGWRSLTTDSVTLNNEKYFSAENVRSLLALGRSASEIEDLSVRAMFQTCVASAIEPAGRLRRDGRALRYVPGRTVERPIAAFDTAFRQVVADVSSVEPAPIGTVARVIDGDARGVLQAVPDAGSNWSVFSPPYPNNIDYTEVYKLEGWVLGFYQDIEDLRSQRLSTLRSHPSLLFPDVYRSEFAPRHSNMSDVLAPVLDAVPSDRYERGRIQVIKGYFDDMLEVFEGVRKALTPSGRVACVVGNSVHGTGSDQFVIASDLLLAAVGELAGFEVDEIRIARNLHRRGRGLPHVRESIVMFRNPLI